MSSQTYRLTNGVHHFIIHFRNSIFDEPSFLQLVFTEEKVVFYKNLCHQGRINASGVPRTVVDDLEFQRCKRRDNFGDETPRRLALDLDAKEDDLVGLDIILS